MKQADASTLGARGLRSALVIVPAYNEEAALQPLLGELRAHVPELPVLVVCDGCTDQSAQVAASLGARVLDLPCNLGVGGAVQAGFQYALEQGFELAIRIDGDGQHPPSEIPRMLAAAERSSADLLVGSRFSSGGHVSTLLRIVGIRLLSLFLSLICRCRISDPTSGFWAVRRPLLHYFARSYPVDYPEPEALALLRRQGYRFEEVPVSFRARQAGQSTIGSWGTIYYALKVGLALIVDRVRVVDRRYVRSQTARLS